MPIAKVEISPQQLLSAIEQLKDQEFENFLAQVLNLQSQRQTQPNQTNNFLSAITGLGYSQDKNVSEQVEEILQKEIDPVQGWRHLKP